MFDKELFYALCDKYGVELSTQYDKPMVKVDGEIRELVEQDVKNVVNYPRLSASDGGF